jgi:drug/metabolite transporter (DMT)-like permease
MQRLALLRQLLWFALGLVPILHAFGLQASARSDKTHISTLLRSSRCMRVAAASSSKQLQLKRSRSCSFTCAAAAEDLEHAAPSPWDARASLLFVAALYGTNYGSIRYLQDLGSSDAVAAVRFLIAGAVTAPWLWKIPSPVLVSGAQIGLLNALGYFGQSLALETTSSSKTAFICSLAVLTVPCFEAIEGRTPPERSAWLSAAAAAVGVLFLELGGLSEVVAAPNQGDLIALAQPLFFGLGYWRLAAAAKQWPGQALPLVAASSVAAAAAFTAWAWSSHSLLSAEQLVAAFTREPALLGTLLWTAVVTTAVTAWLEARSLLTLTAAEATVLYSTEPLFATAFAAAALGESWGGWNAAAGAVMIVGACTWPAVVQAVKDKLG